MQEPPQELDQYEQELDSIPVKALLADIAASNHAILQELRGVSEGSESETKQFECLMCHETVLEENREKHAVETHNAPQGLNLESQYIEQ